MSERRVAVVTGSSSGIGEAIASAFAADGWQVVVNSATSVEAGREVAERIGGTYVQADVSDPGQASELIATAVDRHGRLDMLLSSAGTTVTIPHDDLEAVTPEVWERILSVNMLAPWWLAVAAMPHLQAAPEGQIINITSTSATRVEGSSIPYSVSKAGLQHMTRLLAKAFGPEVRVNAVAPGFTETPWTRDWDEIRAMVEERVPLRRAGRPEDVAEACLAISRGSYMTGAVVPVDGGLSLL